MFIGTNDEDFTVVHKAVDEACIKAGRDPATLHRTAGVMIDLPGRKRARLRCRPIVRPVR